MAQGKLPINSSTQWLRAKNDTRAHIHGSATFGGGTVALEQNILGTPKPVLDKDNSMAPVEFTAAFDSDVMLSKNDIIRLTLSGATSPSLEWSITGDLEPYQA